MKQTIIKINLNSLCHNYNYSKLLSPLSKTLAVIKANAYGHGLIEIAQKLETINVDGFAIANLSEGVELRQNNIKNNNIIILQGINNEKQWNEALKYNLIPMIHNNDQVNYYLKNEKLFSTQKIWIKIDTGMHRLGIQPNSIDSILPSFINKFGKENIVLCSHFACSDELESNFNQEQLDIFTRIQNKYNLNWSIANSAAIMTLPKSHGTYNRAGYMLYGNSPLDQEHETDKNLKHVMEVTAPIIAIREISPGESVGYSRTWYATNEPKSYIATVAIGYADGYPRHAKSGTPVLYKGEERCPLVGRVSMDMITIDVTHLINTGKNVQIGDEITLWGEKLTANEIAKHAGTIGYELLTKITNRPQKIYIS